MNLGELQCFEVLLGMIHGIMLGKWWNGFYLHVSWQIEMADKRFGFLKFTIILPRNFTSLSVHSAGKCKSLFFSNIKDTLYRSGEHLAIGKV